VNTEWELCDDGGKYSTTQERLAWDEFYRRGVPDDDVKSFSFSVINPSSGMLVNGMFKRLNIVQPQPTYNTVGSIIRKVLKQNPIMSGIPNINDLEDNEPQFATGHPPVRANTTQKYHLKDAQTFCDEQRSLAEDFMSSLTIDAEVTKVVAFVLYDVLYIFIRSDVSPKTVISFTTTDLMLLHVFYCESKTFHSYDTAIRNLKQCISVQPHLDTKTIELYHENFMFTRVPLIADTTIEPTYT